MAQSFGAVRDTRIDGLIASSETGPLSTSQPLGTSIDTIGGGNIAGLSIARRLSNGGLGGPLKENPNIASTTRSKAPAIVSMSSAAINTIWRLSSCLTSPSNKGRFGRRG